VPALSFFFDLRRSPGGASSADLVRAVLDICAWADALEGLDVSVGFPEHHGSPDGYLPAPIVLAAAVTGTTTRMRISVVLVASFYDPLRLAEDLAILDLVSAGRIDIVLAAGYVPAEFEMFGIRPGSRGERVEKVVEVLKQAWTGEPFEIDGRLARIMPRPFRDPRPPLVLGGSSPAAARRAARIGDYFAPTPNLELIRVHRAEMIALGKDPGPEQPAPPRLQTLVAVADDPDAVWAQVGPHCLYEVNAYAAWMTAAFGADLSAGFGDHHPYEPADDIATLRARGRYLVLTPQECIDRARDQGGAIAINPLTGGIPGAVAWKSLRLLKEEVLPALRG
jgi:alkanesulfonate monooxygenase SsuD/methylene tetrahydromethanopterin reductase-like flavin-dependent oxidoreductase (luciferase family)